MSADSVWEERHGGKLCTGDTFRITLDMRPVHTWIEYEQRGFDRVSIGCSQIMGEPVKRLECSSLIDFYKPLPEPSPFDRLMKKIGLA